jgi:succinate dehydrogenase/fumarate reductase-like Fe-S protein
VTQKSVKVTVARYDPSTDKAPREETFKVPLKEHMSVLDALDYIYQNLDGTLAYYDHAACDQGICRRCLAVINGELSLMCQTLVEEDITVAPLSRFEVVRDLVYTRGR